MLSRHFAFVGLVSVVLWNPAHAQQTTRVSLDWQWNQLAQASGDARITPDGRWIVFDTASDGVVFGDTNGKEDVFVRDMQTGSIERISVDSNGQQGDGDSGWPGISADGRYVVFMSDATNLVSSDTNGVFDIFLRDRLLGTTERVNLSTSGQQADGYSIHPSVSDDGRFVAFLSGSTNLGTNPCAPFLQVFVRDRQSATTLELSYMCGVWVGATHALISGNGRFVAYEFPASPSGAEIRLHDLQAGTDESVSFGIYCTLGSISPNGRFVSFTSRADLLPGDTNGYADVYLRDRQLAVTFIVSVSSSAQQGNADAYSEVHASAVSPDGRLVAFTSSATNLVPGDTTAGPDVFLRDMQVGSTERVSVDSAGGQAYGFSVAGGVSADGRLVVFRSGADNLVAGDNNGVSDVFLRDRGVALPGPYCTAKTNSLGCVPAIGYSGLPSMTGPDTFYVTASNVLNLKSGMMLWAGQQANNPFHGGTLCLAAPIVRTPLQNSGGNGSGTDCSGTYSYHFTEAYMFAQFLSPGSVVCCQFWSRDPGFPIPNNIGLTDGLQFVIGP